jgi:hypothetical protein
LGSFEAAERRQPPPVRPGRELWSLRRSRARTGGGRGPVVGAGGRRVAISPRDGRGESPRFETAGRAGRQWHGSGPPARSPPGPAPRSRPAPRAGERFKYRHTVQTALSGISGFMHQQCGVAPRPVAPGRREFRRAARQRGSAGHGRARAGQPDGPLVVLERKRRRTEPPRVRRHPLTEPTEPPRATCDGDSTRPKGRCVPGARARVDRQ